MSNQEMKPMFIRKIYLSSIVFLLLINSVMAQFDVRVTAAYGNMSLKPVTGLNLQVDPGSFLTAGLQIDYYITERLGVGIGGDYYLKDSKFNAILSNYSHVHYGTDNWEGDPIPRDYEFTIRSNGTNGLNNTINNTIGISDIVEENTMAFVDVPISVIYNLPLFGNVKLATRVGAKVSIPLSGNYVLTESDLYTRLYFPVWDLELFNIPAHGLYDSRTDWHPEGELELNTTVSAFTEIGLDFPVSMLNIRVSGYFSYGLNDLIATKETSLVYWREDYNSTLTLAESVNTMQYGIKVGIGLNPNRNKGDRSPSSRLYKKSGCNCGTPWQ